MIECRRKCLALINECWTHDIFYQAMSDVRKNYCKKAPVDLAKYIQLRCNSLFPIGSFPCTTHVKQE